MSGVPLTEVEQHGKAAQLLTGRSWDFETIAAALYQPTETDHVMKAWKHAQGVNKVLHGAVIKKKFAIEELRRKLEQSKKDIRRLTGIDAPCRAEGIAQLD